MGADLQRTIFYFFPPSRYINLKPLDRAVTGRPSLRRSGAAFRCHWVLRNAWHTLGAAAGWSFIGRVSVVGSHGSVAFQDFLGRDI